MEGGRDERCWDEIIVIGSFSQMLICSSPVGCRKNSQKFTCHLSYAAFKYIFEDLRQLSEQFLKTAKNSFKMFLGRV
jgi:hypothetical protein